MFNKYLLYTIRGQTDVFFPPVSNNKSSDFNNRSLFKIVIYKINITELF